MVERILLALVFALISIGILMLSFKILKTHYDHKKNIWASIIFALCIYIFSFFPNIFLTLLTILLVLLVLKYLYIRTWKETFKVWGIWLVSWLIIFALLALTLEAPSLF